MIVKVRDRPRKDKVFQFVLGLGLFVGVHLARVVAPGWRDAAIARWGEGPWKGLYSLASLLGLILLGRGYTAAYGEMPLLYEPASWGRHVLWSVMAAAFVLAVASGGPVGRIRRSVGDPLLVATILWASAHLLVRSDVLHVLLFGGFLVWAVADLISVRRRRAAGLVERSMLAAGPTPWIADGIALAVGIGLYLAFMLGVHEWLFGVSPVGR